MADMHFDAPFTVLNTKGNLGEMRRLEQREAFKQVITYIKENQIEYFFIAGDLYENEYIRKTTIEYINELFQEIPETKIYIAPGNHDPNLINSFYTTFKWSKNVTIFQSSIQKIEEEDVDIYGFGFSDFYCKNSGIEDIKIENPNKINILVVHGDIDGGNSYDIAYNPMSRNLLKKLGFDYIALGHIHIPDYQTEENQRIVYPGSTIAMGFDELGTHGIIVGELTKENIQLEFLPIDLREFKEIFIDISSMISIEEIIEKINVLDLDKNNFYKLILIGNRNFEIDLSYLNQFVLKENLIKIKDQTKLNLDLNKIASHSNLQGIFVKNILQDLSDGKIEKDLSEKIIEMGLHML